MSRIRTRLKLMLGLNVLMAAITIPLAYVTLAPMYREWADAASVSFGSDGQLTFSGSISPASARKLANFLTHNAEAIQYPRFLYIGSPGGEYSSAEEVARIINHYNLMTFVSKKSVCASACVYVFTHSLRRYALPDALFLFHRARRGDLTLDQKFLNLFATMETPAIPEDVMRQWASRISPKLTEFFDTCAVDPTRTDSGIWLLWSEIQEIDMGQRSYNCDALASRDAQWVHDFQQADSGNADR